MVFLKVYMNNNFKFLINCILLCVVTAMIALFLGYFSDRLVSGSLILSKDMVWLSLLYPDLFGVLGKLVIVIFNNLMFLSVFFLVVTVGLLFNFTKKINAYSFFLGLFIVFLINTFIFIATYTITSDLSVFMYVKFIMLAFVSYFSFKFRSLYFFV